MLVDFDGLLTCDVLTVQHDVAVGGLIDAGQQIEDRGFACAVGADEAVQLSLFRDEKKERARKLDQTVDQLRGKFGVTAISRGSVTDASRRVGRKYKAELDPGQK